MKAIIFDTETIGKTTQTLWNVGYKICEIDLTHATAHTLIERDLVVKPLIENKSFMVNDDFVGLAKYEKVIEQIKNGGTIPLNIDRIFEQMMNDIHRHQVEYGYAYNCAFDVDKFTKTAVANGLINPLEAIQVLDIWGYAGEYIINKPDYIEWARANQIYTATERFIKTSVEGVTAFLENNTEFVEEHLALSDVQWETKILLECIKRGADITQVPKRCGFIPSGREWHKTIVLPNGDEIEVDYTRMRETDSKIIFS